MRIFRGEGEIRRSVGVALSLIWSQVVSRRGEHAILIKSQETLPMDKPEVVSTRAILKRTHGK